MKQSALLTLILSFFCYSGLCQSCPIGLAGTLKVGPTGTYKTLGAALSDLTAKGLAGPVLLELQTTYSSAGELFPLTLKAVPCASFAKGVTIRPEGGATQLSITSNDPLATLDIRGGSAYTIDGRPAGAGSGKALSIRNTNTKGNAIRLSTGARQNELQFLDVQGVSTGIAPGVILFDTAGNTAGNAYNHIDSCDIHGGATPPLYGILAVDWQAAKNTGNAINGCNVYNMAGNSINGAVGIYIRVGYDSFMVSGNSVYQTPDLVIPYTPDTTYFYTAISVGSISDGGHTVIGNFIGGTQPGAKGAPLVVTRSSQWTGIAVHSFSGANMATQVTGNTITNITWQGLSTSFINLISLGFLDRFNGSCSNNILGNKGSGYSLRLTNPQPNSATFDITAIQMTADYYDNAKVKIHNNFVGGIMADAGMNSVFFGIFASCPTTPNGVVSIDSNQIGDDNAANSIFVKQATAIQLDEPNVDTPGDTVLVADNRIANINGSGDIVGIYDQFLMGYRRISGNTIHDLVMSGFGQLYGIKVYHDGYFFYPQGSYCFINNNTIAGLSSYGSTYGTSGIMGIWLYAFGTGTPMQFYISGNTIKSLDSYAAGTGIWANCGFPGTVDNNMIDLGLRGNGHRGLNPYNTGIAGGGVMDILHNTVYMYSAAQAYSPNTVCLDADPTPKKIMNNIFAQSVNDPKTVSGLIYLEDPNKVDCDYNQYFSTVRAGVAGIGYSFSPNFGLDTTLAEWQAHSGKDRHSIYADPRFVHPEDSWPNIDLHLQKGTPADKAGTAAFTTITDIDGKVRAQSTPVDLGAAVVFFSDSIPAPPGDSTVQDSTSTKHDSSSTTPKDTISLVRPYPNPFSGNLAIVVHAKQAGIAYISIISQTGKLEKTMQVPVNSGDNTVTIPMNNYPDGYYVVHVEVGDSKQTKAILKKSY